MHSEPLSLMEFRSNKTNCQYINYIIYQQSHHRYSAHNVFIIVSWSLVIDGPSYSALYTVKHYILVASKFGNFGV